MINIDEIDNEKNKVANFKCNETKSHQQSSTISNNKKNCFFQKKNNYIKKMRLIKKISFDQIKLLKKKFILKNK